VRSEVTKKVKEMTERQNNLRENSPWREQ